MSYSCAFAAVLALFTAVSSLFAAGERRSQTTVDWFGFDTDFAPHGLATRNYRDIMDRMQARGFDTVRLHFATQMFDPGATPNAIDFSRNPELRGLSPIQIMD